MWSKTRKALYERMAPSLTGRVMYEVQHYQHLKCRCSMCANYCKQFMIVVDRKHVYTIAGAGALSFDLDLYKKVLNDLHLTSDMVGYWHTDPDGVNEYRVDNRMFYYTGLMPFSKIMPRLHIYLNCADIEQCLSRDDYLLYLFAVLDRRVGKRRIRKIYQGIDSEPEWIRKFIILRAEAEGIINKDAVSK